MTHRFVEGVCVAQVFVYKCEFVYLCLQRSCIQKSLTRCHTEPNRTRTSHVSIDLSSCIFLTLLLLIAPLSPFACVFFFLPPVNHVSEKTNLPLWTSTSCLWHRAAWRGSFWSSGHKDVENQNWSAPCGDVWIWRGLTRATKQWKQQEVKNQTEQEVDASLICNWFVIYFNNSSEHVRFFPSFFRNQSSKTWRILGDVNHNQVFCSFQLAQRKSCYKVYYFDI